MANILVVDDDPLFLDMIQRALQRDPYYVFKAMDGKEALDELQDFCPDLIILDIFMPQKEGLETLVDIRRAYGTLPVLCISGGKSAESFDPLSCAEKLGASSTLSKPFHIAELRERIANLLGQPA